MRLDALLVERGLISGRELAKSIVMAGDVFVDGRRSDKPGAQIYEDAAIEVRAPVRRFVSRGGYTLERALDFFGVDPTGRVCLDCGASSGGFTDCLLQRGAELVYAVDVGYGQLAWSLRSDARVICRERVNARNLTPEMFPRAPELAVIDVSFISLALILPAVKSVLTPTGDAVCLIKPQFEAGREKVGKRGVVREPETHAEVLRTFLKNASGAGFMAAGITHSPIRGPEGNIEFLGYLKPPNTDSDIDIPDIDIDAIVQEAHSTLTDEAAAKLAAMKGAAR
ncbi:MAG: TlyA family RNA methyltransferase [Oscillospiraceae bacterium]|jgi:23S rRNA (cytidine1920-2'-O)/16S rRNA (cytidine1409-2'-O)-methyltransferase|nr:TlyA family RNA methyltransferase [Oscillospiraceae bacterium]